MNDKDKRIERLEGALQWYADKVMYIKTTGPHSDHCRNELNKDNGRTAREALADDGSGSGEQHQWDRDGERCVKCGAKDWMDAPCHPPTPTPPGNDARGEALEAWEVVKSLVNSPRCQITQKEWADYRSLLDTIHQYLTAPPTVPESVRNLPNKWRRINSGTGEYWLAARKVAQQCAHELDQALAQHGEPGQGECGWSLDDEGCYQTDCGTEFETTDFLTLDEMKWMKYCQNCGRRIRDDSPAPDADER